MEGFDKIRDLNLAELGTKAEEEDSEILEEEDEIGQESEDAQESGSEDVEEDQEQAEGVEEQAPKKKELMEIQGQYYKIESNMKVEYMREFMFNHYFRQPMILIFMVIGAGMLVYGAVARPVNATYIICGLFLVIGYPVSFYLRANSSFKNNPAFQNTFYYTFDEWGLHLKNGDEILEVAWKYIIQVKRLKNLAVLYTGKHNGSLIPYADLGEQKEEILTFIEKMQSEHRK